MLQKTPGGPKTKKDKHVLAETDGAKIVNAEEQGEFTNAEDQYTDDTKDPTEEEMDEQINNRRDALNNDELALPPDETDDDDLN